MPRCVRCQAELEPAARACPACGALPVPAHRAVLEESAPSEDEPAARASEAPPARAPASPSGGWMDRLEAARRTAPSLSKEAEAPLPGRSSPPSRRPSASVLPRPASTPPARTSPPPRPPSAPPPLPKKPAHRLVAQLESEAPAAPAPAPVVDEIASARVDIPRAPAPPPARHRLRDALWLGLLALALVAGLAAAYFSAETEPPPEVRVDPELEAKRARLARARAALEAGHEHALEGKTGADAAIAAYRRALEAAPELAAAERGLAIAFTAKGQEAEAVKHYRRYLALEPDAKDAAEVKKIIRAWQEDQ